MQHSVEILSIAATTYYVVGLVGDIARGAVRWNAALQPDAISAAAVPIVLALVAAIFMLIRRGLLGSEK